MRASTSTRPGHAHPCGWILTALLAAACGEDPIAPVLGAPTAPRATLVLEPPRVGVGDVAILGLVIVTPAGYMARPYAPPPRVPGFWLLGAENLPVEKLGSRWIHRTRIRIRAREVGNFLWPGGSITVEGPEGETQVVGVEELPLEVASVRPEYPDRITPFGARRLETIPGRGGGWSAAAAGATGAVLALAGVALVAGVRRRRQDRAKRPAPNRVPRKPPWIRARSELRRSRSTDDPLTAAHGVATALRRYMDDRFHAAAIARTTEELQQATPPFAATSRWSVFLSILRGLDEFRFRAEVSALDRPAVAERVEDLITRAEALVEETIPPESRS